MQQQQYYEQAPGYGGGGAASGFAAAPMPGYPPGQQVQYVQSAPQAGGYYESAPQFQQQQQYGGGAPALIQAQQPMQRPAQAQHPQFASAPQPAYQQPLGNSGRGKLIKAGRFVPSLCSIALPAPASPRTRCHGTPCHCPLTCLHLRCTSAGHAAAAPGATVASGLCGQLIHAPSFVLLAFACRCLAQVLARQVAEADSG